METPTRIKSCEAGELTVLLASREMDEQGILSRVLTRVTSEEGPVRVIRAFGFRSLKRVAIWVEVEVPEVSTSPWQVGSAVLRNPQGVEVRRVMRVWPLTPLPPGKSSIVAELEAGRDEVLGTYILELHEAGGSRTLTLGQVQFP